jgi:hypothetical protein
MQVATIANGWLREFLGLPAPPSTNNTNQSTSATSTSSTTNTTSGTQPSKRDQYIDRVRATLRDNRTGPVEWISVRVRLSKLCHPIQSANNIGRWL